MDDLQNTHLSYHCVPGGVFLLNSLKVIVINLFLVITHTAKGKNSKDTA